MVTYINTTINSYSLKNKPRRGARDLAYAASVRAQPCRDPAHSPPQYPPPSPWRHPSSSLQRRRRHNRVHGRLCRHHLASTRAHQTRLIHSLLVFTVAPNPPTTRYKPTRLDNSAENEEDDAKSSTVVCISIIRSKRGDQVLRYCS
jgi:hypothetical protein